MTRTNREEYTIRVLKGHGAVSVRHAARGDGARRRRQRGRPGVGRRRGQGGVRLGDARGRPGGPRGGQEEGELRHLPAAQGRSAAFFYTTERLSLT